MAKRGRGAAARSAAAQKGWRTRAAQAAARSAAARKGWRTRAAKAQAQAKAAKARARTREGGVIGPRLARVLQAGVFATLRERVRERGRARRATTQRREAAAYRAWVATLDETQRSAGAMEGSTRRRIGVWDAAAARADVRGAVIARWNPKGFYESLRTGERMSDAQMARVRGSLFYWERVRVWSRHTGLSMGETRRFLRELDRRRRAAPDDAAEYLDEFGVDDLS